MELTTIRSEVLIFKTSLHAPRDVSRISNGLNEDKRISKWTVDLEDIDRVLRIESHNLKPDTVITLLGNYGYHCEELLD
jgi:hypothetical protein